MVSGSKADELQGRGRPLAPSLPPQLHPSLLPPGDSSSDPHPSPAASRGPGLTGGLSPHFNVLAHASSTWKLVAAPARNPVLAAQEPAQLPTQQRLLALLVWCVMCVCSQLENITLSSCFSSPGCCRRVGAALVTSPQRLLAPRAAFLALLSSHHHELGLMATRLPPASLSLPSSLLSLHSSPPLSHCAAFILVHIHGRQDQ